MKECIDGMYVADDANDMHACMHIAVDIDDADYIHACHRWHVNTDKDRDVNDQISSSWFNYWLTWCMQMKIIMQIHMHLYVEEYKFIRSRCIEYVQTLCKL